MSRLGWVGLGLAAVGAVAVSHVVGSRPETDAAGPIEPCRPGVPNCARLRVPLDAPAEDVRAAARRVVAGRAASMAETADGLRATYAAGPFTDDVVVAVEEAPTGSTLWVRSAARLGRSDLGVNGRRARRIAADVRRSLP